MNFFRARPWAYARGGARRARPARASGARSTRHRFSPPPAAAPAPAAAGGAVGPCVPALAFESVQRPRISPRGWGQTPRPDTSDARREGPRERAAWPAASRDPTTRERRARAWRARLPDRRPERACPARAPRCVPPGPHPPRPSYSTSYFRDRCRAGASGRASEFGVRAGPAPSAGPAGRCAVWRRDASFLSRVRRPVSKFRSVRAPEHLTYTTPPKHAPRRTDSRASNAPWIVDIMGAASHARVTMCPERARSRALHASVRASICSTSTPGSVGRSSACLVLAVRTRGVDAWGWLTPPWPWRHRPRRSYPPSPCASSGRAPWSHFE